MSTGASAQAPTQLTASRLNPRSSVVSPGSIPSRRSSSSRINGAPRIWHAVPVHTRSTFSPRGVSEKLL